MNTFSLLRAATFCLTAIAASTAFASPTIGVRIFRDGFFQSGSVASSSSGLLIASTGGDGFSSGITVTGSPILPSPVLVSSLSLTSTVAGFYRVQFTETDLPRTNSDFALRFSVDPSSSQFVSVSESFYASGLNVSFGTDTLIASAQFTGPGSATAQSGGYNFPNALFSLTGIFDVTFGAGGGTVNARIQESSAAAVPEPATVLLVATGLMGLVTGGLRRRRGQPVMHRGRNC